MNYFFHTTQEFLDFFLENEVHETQLNCLEIVENNLETDLLIEALEFFSSIANVQFHFPICKSLLHVLAQKSPVELFCSVEGKDIPHITKIQTVQKLKLLDTLLFDASLLLLLPNLSHLEITYTNPDVLKEEMDFSMLSIFSGLHTLKFNVPENVDTDKIKVNPTVPNCIFNGYLSCNQSEIIDDLYKKGKVYPQQKKFYLSSQLHPRKAQFFLMDGIHRFFPNLEELSIYGAGVHFLPKNLLQLKKLKILNISKTNIFEIPDWLKDCSSLEQVITYGLKCRPQDKDTTFDLFQYPKDHMEFFLYPKSWKKDIKFLNLSQKNLSFLPPDLKDFSSLVHLDLSYNPMKLQREDLAGLEFLQNLEILDLRGLYIDPEYDFPKVLLKLPKLRKVKCFEQKAMNSILCKEHPYFEKNMQVYKEKVPTLFWKENQKINVNTQKIITFNLANRELIQIPFEQLPNLRKLIFKNQIHPLSKKQLKTLVGFDLFDESSIDSSVLRWCKITSIIFENCHPQFVDSLMPVLMNVPWLEHLSITDSKLRTVPVSLFSNLPKLKFLNLSDNKILEIPDSIENCTNLEELNISYNYIQYLPSKLSTLPHLSHLNIRSTLIESLPIHIHKLQNFTCDSSPIYSAIFTEYTYHLLNNTHQQRIFKNAIFR